MTGYLIILIIFTTALSKTVLQDLHTAFTRSLAAATRGEEGHRVRWSEGSPLPEDSTPLGGWNEWVPDLTLLFLQPHHLCYIWDHWWTVPFHPSSLGTEDTVRSTGLRSPHLPSKINTAHVYGSFLSPKLLSAKFPTSQPLLGYNPHFFTLMETRCLFRMLHHEILPKVWVLYPLPECHCPGLHAHRHALHCRPLLFCPPEVLQLGVSHPQNLAPSSLESSTQSLGQLHQSLQIFTSGSLSVSPTLHLTCFSLSSVSS